MSRPGRAVPFAFLVALLALTGACDLLRGEDDRPGAADPGELPPTPPQSPIPGQPPLVWVAGAVERIDEDVVALRSREDALISMQRLASGATRFFVTADGTWRELEEAEVDRLADGRDACAEALLDGVRLVAVRVFLDARCGPA